MAGPQTIWGIDIGRCALKAVKLRSGSDGNVELVAHDYIEHPKILSQPDANREELISDALEKFLSGNDLSKDGVVVSVPGQHTLARFTKLPPVAAKKIPDIVRYEADQQIPFDMDEVIWDYQTFGFEGVPNVEVGIFAMKRELIREHLLHFEQASVEPIAVQASPLAAYNAVHFDGLLCDETTIILDIGAENTDLIISTPDNLWSRTIAIGGNSFTDALVKSFKLSFTKAENLKRTASSSKYARQVFQAMRPVFADLVQELQRSIGFYSSTHREAEIEKIVGVGNAFQLPGLQKYLQQNLGLDVHRPETFNKVKAPADSEFIKQLPSFAVSYGLAIQGLELSKVTSNLLPTEIAKQMVWRRKRPAFAAAAACLLLAGGLIWFCQKSDLSALRADVPDPRIATVDDAVRAIEGGGADSGRANAKLVLAAGKKLKSELTTKQSEGQAEQDQIDELIRLQKQKQIIPAIMQIIHESIPRPTGALGQAETQAAVLAALSESPTRRDVRKQILIEKVDMLYATSLASGYIDSEFTSQIETDYADAILGDAPESGGLVVKIKCLSPNENASKLVHETFMKSLRELGRRPGMGFYFNRVYLVGGERIGSDEEAGSKAWTPTSTIRGTTPLGTRGGGGRDGRGRGGVGTVTPRGGTIEAVEETYEEELVEFDPAIAKVTDPITGEPTAGDWRIEVIFDVIFEDVDPDVVPAEEGEVPEGPSTRDD